MKTHLLNRFNYAVSALLLALMFSLALAAAPAASADELAGLEPDEITIVNLINEYRFQHGLGALELQQNLTAAAGWMAQDLADKNYFSHTDSLGRDAFQRQEDFGYFGAWKGENLAAGRAAPERALIQWKNSPSHNDNLLRPEFKQVGIARYYNPDSTYKYYWALTFGSMEP